MDAALVLASLALSDVLALARRARRHEVVTRRPLAVAAGLALGLAPYAIENVLLYGSPIAPGYVGIAIVHESARAETAGDGGVATSAVERSAIAARGVWRYFDGLSTLREPADVPSATYAAWVSPGPGAIEYGILMLSPLLALAPLGAWAEARSQGPRGPGAFFAIHAILMFVVYGTYARHAGGLEARYLSPLYPALAWYAAAHASRALGASRRFLLPVAAGATILGLALALVAPAAAPEHRYSTHLVFTRRLGLAAVAIVLALVAAAALARRFVPARRELAEGAGVIAWAFGAIPAAVFLVLHGVVHSRVAWGGVEDGGIRMFLPAMEVARGLVVALVA